MAQDHEIIDCLVLKLPIKAFGNKAKQIKDLYPEAKVLVFQSEPWHVTAMNAAAFNQHLLYVLAKWQDEYFILAEKRLGELQLRSGHKFKKLLTFTGETLEDMLVEHPLS